MSREKVTFSFFFLFSPVSVLFSLSCSPLYEEGRRGGFFSFTLIVAAPLVFSNSILGDMNIQRIFFFSRGVLVLLN